MENEHKKSKISLSKPEDIPQPDYTYEDAIASDYQQPYEQPIPKQQSTSSYTQNQQTVYRQDNARRLHQADTPNVYQQNNSPVPRNTPFQQSNYAQNHMSQTGTKFCKHCGYTIPFDAVVCTACGRQVEQLNQQPNGNYQQNNYHNVYNTNININNGNISPKNRSIAGVLCALGFFGFGGIHRLYTGKIFTGILYLCTGGLCGIGTIVDLVRLLNGTFTDNQGRQLKD